MQSRMFGSQASCGAVSRYRQGGKGAIYVLHAFQKKSKTGIRTPQAEIDKIKSRLKDATELYAESDMKNKIKSTGSSGNVFADLGLPNADEHLIKADIVLTIAARIKAKKLTQSEASNLIGLAQPDVSKLLRGHFTGYSFERLFGFLTALGDNVKIAVSPAKSKKHARLELELS